jgi:hypothetical protein
MSAALTAVLSRLGCFKEATISGAIRARYGASTAILRDVTALSSAETPMPADYEDGTSVGETLAATKLYCELVSKHDLNDDRLKQGLPCAKSETENNS